MAGGGGDGTAAAVAKIDIWGGDSRRVKRRFGGRPAGAHPPWGELRRTARVPLPRYGLPGTHGHPARRYRGIEIAAHIFSGLPRRIQAGRQGEYCPESSRLRLIRQLAAELLSGDGRQ